MNAVEKCENELGKRKAHLAKLNQEKADLAEAIESLKAERSQAVRILASGNASQRKRILKLESEISSVPTLAE